MLVGTAVVVASFAVALAALVADFGDQVGGLAAMPATLPKKAVPLTPVAMMRLAIAGWRRLVRPRRTGGGASGAFAIGCNTIVSVMSPWFIVRVLSPVVSPRRA